MAPKNKIPAPIDRPLAKSYLREFTGWSTEFPPGLSDPTSLRLMENVMINRDGSARVRPGLRFLSYGTLPPDDDTPGLAFPQELVGTHEVFFLNDGTKAYLFAVREPSGEVGFRVLRLNNEGSLVVSLSDAGFDLPQGEEALRFSAGTTYVKYVQIDNKIFALSNNGERMRLFYVGTDKIARALSSIERPAWTVEDKLDVVHPNATWILSGTPASTRKNFFINPSFEGTLQWQSRSVNTAHEVITGDAVSGTKSLELRPTATRTNFIGDPLTNVANRGIGTWWKKGLRASSIAVSGNAIRVNYTNIKNSNVYLEGTKFAVTPNTTLVAAYNITAKSSNSEFARLVADFYNASGALINTQRRYGLNANPGRHVFDPIEVPPNAVSCKIQPYINTTTSTAAGYFSINNFAVVPLGESTDVFSGDSGTNYFWLGTPYHSTSVYQPPVNSLIVVDKATVAAGKTYSLSAQVKSSHLRPLQIGVEWYTSADVFLGGQNSPLTAVQATGEWELRKLENITAPAEAVTARFRIFGQALELNNKLVVDTILLEEGPTVGAYFDGDTPNAPPVIYSWDGTANASASSEVEFDSPAEPPEAQVPTEETLISSDSSENDYSFGFFYVFSNEIGESAPSQITQIKAQRSWSQWLWVLPDNDGNPSETPTMNAADACDQFVATMPEDVYNQARAQGAVSWSLYAMAWSDQEVVPTTGVLIDTKEFSPVPDYGLDGWIRITSQSFALSEDSAPLPTANSRYNYSDPSRAGQGLVASDRMVLVYDPVDAAVIRWSSNLQGNYTNFTANKGGGYKTLTSGNLYVPACVKLWQNPQSVDTLTVLCMGVDGYSTGYYMAPAQVAQQSEATNIMGFEETTATPGTTSPYGCEVLNNALYHPLDDQLMKSTATNYNINHKSMTDQIQKMWSQLARKDRIISSQLDNRLYFIVNNPEGAALQPGQNGNEIWVYDTAGDGGTWSRWMVQAHSLRKIEYNGQVYMSVISRDGIYYFDPMLSRDDYVASDGTVLSRSIPWLLETNTQGANRAHDAWCRLQQAQVLVGNFQGTLRYGIKSWDVNGKPIEVSKVLRNLDEEEVDIDTTFDYEDQLRIARDVKEWFFFAESIEEDGEILHSAGQVSAVQYRFTPVSVNVGYEYGSIETFEYGRATANWAERTTDNGVPTPFNDTRLP